MNKSAQQLRNLTDQELLNKADEIRKSLFNLHKRAATKELQNIIQITKERRELARVKTILHERKVKI